MTNKTRELLLDSISQLHTSCTHAARALNLATDEAALVDPTTYFKTIKFTDSAYRNIAAMKVAIKNYEETISALLQIDGCK